MFMRRDLLLNPFYCSVWILTNVRTRMLVVLAPFAGISWVATNAAVCPDTKGIPELLARLPTNALELLAAVVRTAKTFQGTIDASARQVSKAILMSDAMVTTGKAFFLHLVFRLFNAL